MDNTDKIKDHRQATNRCKQNKQQQQDRYIFDEIGLKIKCYRCSEYYYQFQQHPQMCRISNHIASTDSKANILFNHQQIRPQLPKYEHNQQIMHKQQNNNKQQNVIDIKEQEIAELNSFQQAISKIVEIKKSRLQGKQPIQPKQLSFLTVSCPFCSKTLQLHQLEHTDSCHQATHCQYCNEKIAMRLKTSHYLVCPNKLQKVRTKNKPKVAYIKHQLLKQQKKEQPIIQQNRQIKTRPNRWKQDFLNRQPNIKKQQQAHLKALNQVPNINRYELDMQSLIRNQKKKGIAQSTFTKLPRVEYKKGQFASQDMCTVGYQQFTQGQYVIKLACSHIFHQDCLQPYLKDHISCPVCKKEIRSLVVSQNA